jgi:hypothetical protein
MDNYRAVTQQNPNYFLTYGNGKSAARVQPGLRPNGAHRFHNYGKQPKEMKAAEAAVLHFTYTTFADILARKSRCDCPKVGWCRLTLSNLTLKAPGLKLLKLTRHDPLSNFAFKINLRRYTKDEESLKQCFILEFDRVVYTKWDEMSEEQMREFYNERVVYRDAELKKKILSNGLFARMYTPKLIMDGIKQAEMYDAASSTHRGDAEEADADVAGPADPVGRGAGAGAGAGVAKATGGDHSAEATIRDGVKDSKR